MNAESSDIGDSNEISEISNVSLSRVGIPLTVEDEVADPLMGQSIRFDVLILLTGLLVTALYCILVPALRSDSPAGTALRQVSLQRVLTVVLGILALAAVIGERTGGVDDRHAMIISRPVRYVAGAMLALWTFYVVSFVYFGLELATDSLLPTVAEYGALLALLALWQPWTRLSVYRHSARRLLPALLVSTSVLVVWQLIVQIFNIKQFLLPAPTVILTTFGNIYPRLVAQGWITFQNALWGFGIGCGLGILTGLLSARFGNFSRAIMPYAIAANSIPIIAFAPITNNWFGIISPWSKIAVIIVLTYFPAMLNTLRGLTLADPSALALMRSYAASDRETFVKVRWPTALPYIFSALKLACTLSMIGAIVAEYFGGPITGLGVNIANDAALSRYPTVWSEIIIASALGIGFYFLVSLIERLVMPWHISFRAND